MQKRKSVSLLKLEHIGPIESAEVTFGDLTVFIGPQATGKSIFLQFFKLILDKRYIHEQLRKYGIDWDQNIAQFLDVYLGEGMQGIWRPGKSSLKVNQKSWNIEKLARVKMHPGQEKKVFYIPAQRVLSLANGWPRPFQSFSSQDPFVLRDFSETFRLLLEQELSRTEQVFPKTKRLKREYRNLLSKHLFGNFGLYVDHHGAQKRLVLRAEKRTPSIPFLAWSAGQREFVPLLMGLYWLMPPTRTKQRNPIEWIIIEELEMGLHPNAISVVLLLILELLWRGYRVCLSAHSPHILDVIWAIRKIREYKTDPDYLLDIFQASRTPPLRRVAQSALKKEIQVYYFDPDGKSHNISQLDPGSEDRTEAGWGGLTEFSGRVNEVVAQLVAANSARNISEESSRSSG